ncbi:MAG: CinA family protein [Nitrospirae bacterium]|nr:CinA family protein [Nitrospirota bacterium]
MLSEFDNIIRIVHDYFIENSMSLSVAESCTGGLVMHLITNIPGASKYFTGGVVAYSERIKVSILKVPEEVVRRYGVVSEETAIAMASGVRKTMGTHIGISTTGNLGPETLEGKEVGLVCFGYSSEKRVVAKRAIFKGSRGEVKEKAALYCLENLIDFLKK